MDIYSNIQVIQNWCKNEANMVASYDSVADVDDYVSTSIDAYMFFHISDSEPYSYASFNVKNHRITFGLRSSGVDKFLKECSTLLVMCLLEGRDEQ